MSHAGRRPDRFNEDGIEDALFQAALPAPPLRSLHSETAGLALTNNCLALKAALSRRNTYE
jgi:hypothetical protein